MVLCIHTLLLLFHATFSKTPSKTPSSPSHNYVIQICKISNTYEDEPPPPYSDVATAPEANSTVTTQITIGVLQQTGYPEGRENTTNNLNTRSEGRENATNNQNAGTHNTSNSFNGFLDIMFEQRKLPSGMAKNMIYRVPLLVYYLTNFIYSIVAVAVQREHLAYHFIYMFTCLTG